MNSASVQSIARPTQPMHLSPTVAWTVVPDVGLYNVTERPQYGFPFDWVPMNAKGKAIAMSLPVLTVQPHAPRPRKIHCQPEFDGTMAQLKAKLTTIPMGNVTFTGGTLSLAACAVGSGDVLGLDIDGGGRRCRGSSSRRGRRGNRCSRGRPGGGIGRVSWRRHSSNSRHG